MTRPVLLVSGTFKIWIQHQGYPDFFDEETLDGTTMHLTKFISQFRASSASKSNSLNAQGVL